MGTKNNLKTEVKDVFGPNFGDITIPAPQEIYVSARLIPWGAFKHKQKGTEEMVAVTVAGKSIGFCMVFLKEEDAHEEFPNDTVFALRRRLPEGISSSRRAAKSNLKTSKGVAKDTKRRDRGGQKHRPSQPGRTRGGKKRAP